MVINNWFVLAAGFMQVTTIYHSIFFVLFFAFRRKYNDAAVPKVIINLVVLNILIALIIDTSAVVRKEIEESEASNCFMFCCVQSPAESVLGLQRLAN